MASEISRPGAPASAKFMAWAILNGKSLAWANEKYEKSSSGRDFHPKNILAWTSSNGKFLGSFGFRVFLVLGGEEAASRHRLNTSPLFFQAALPRGVRFLRVFRRRVHWATHRFISKNKRFFYASFVFFSFFFQAALPRGVMFLRVFRRRVHWAGHRFIRKNKRFFYSSFVFFLIFFFPGCAPSGCEIFASFRRRVHWAGHRFITKNKSFFYSSFFF